MTILVGAGGGGGECIGRGESGIGRGEIRTEFPHAPCPILGLRLRLPHEGRRKRGLKAGPIRDGDSYFLSSLAMTALGSALTSFSHLSQQRKNVRPSAVTLNGLPIS